MKSNALSLAALFLLTTLAGCGGEPESPPPPPPAVTVATPIFQQVIDWDDFIGRFEAVQSVEVRPRVTGYLRGVQFTDGDFVRAGQTLFTIDRSEFRIASKLNGVPAGGV